MVYTPRTPNRLLDSPALFEGAISTAKRARIYRQLGELSSPQLDEVQALIDRLRSEGGDPRPVSFRPALRQVDVGDRGVGVVGYPGETDLEVDW